ncbi:MAG: FliH/SctL family protein [Planctomycetota bacterium]
MQFIRSRAVAGQATALAQAGAERARVAAETESRRLRDEGRLLGIAESRSQIEAAERRAQDAERNATEHIKRIQAEAEQRLGIASAALERAAANISIMERQIVAGAEAEIVRLGLAVAAKILMHQVETDPTWMRSMVAAALAEVPDRRHVVVRCAPKDAAEIRTRLATVAAEVPGTERLQLEADEALQPGSLVMAAGGTRLDASVATSWERVAHQIIAIAPTPPLAMRDDGTIPQVTP